MHLALILLTVKARYNGQGEFFFQYYDTIIMFSVLGIELPTFELSGEHYKAFTYYEPFHGQYLQ